GLLLFAYSTLIGWYYYGEKCFTYLAKDSNVLYYRIVFVMAVFFGAVFQNDFVRGVADLLNGLMAIPNLIGLIGLSGVVVW
ncbi:alanine:cation symporter family protein, partial [Bacillus sp. SIMBA_005]|uniref:alanine:cation symporter family protein n=1 Tax=Bacillus sp. SIMBA_005 TaxID=3085754 RepID=UPI003979F409